ncbi:uncharacterized protein LOC120016043 [Tripterygium wilfordii]|uniref:uncharacterized protein LOC120016043 n=1 Tax=Tripterygium wilfordii TaxID=458696 RepID=UPI0018F7FD12|nr:uncharacterized protein LOC120016043 [Tripterygium wilfordii]XP_038724546.1 uncharacterized protein LOC120016043 [Tripterygium wilfordii]
MILMLFGECAGGCNSRERVRRHKWGQTHAHCHSRLHQRAHYDSSPSAFKCFSSHSCIGMERQFISIDTSPRKGSMISLFILPFEVILFLNFVFLAFTDFSFKQIKSHFSFKFLRSS